MLQFLMPLIYLLLSHHYRLIDLCTREVVPEEDFISAAGSLASIYAAAQERADNLEGCSSFYTKPFPH